MRVRQSCAVLLLLVLSACAHVQQPAGSEGLRIYLARHGQTDWNVALRYQGLTDTNLNDTGREQARELGRRLDGITLDRIYTSALRRTRETASIAEPGATLESLPALNEHGLGKFEGFVHDGSNPAVEQEYERRFADENDSLDGGESMKDFTARVCGAVDTIVKENPKGTVLVVAHSGTNAAFLRCVFQLTAQQTAMIQQSNDELYLIEISKPHPPRLWKLIPRDKLGEL